MKKYLLLISLSALIMCLWSCSGEDRSDEQPFKPTVRILSATIQGDSCLLKGEVLSSPNSTLVKCGFYYGSSAAEKKEKAARKTATIFEAATDSLASGTYYAIAYATNGVGTSTSDTLYFDK